MRSSASERGPLTPAGILEGMLIVAIVAVLAAAAGIGLPVAADPDARFLAPTAAAAAVQEDDGLHLWSAEPQSPDPATP